MSLQSDEINEIAAAMVEVQNQIGPAAKGKTNPFFKSSYATLGDVWEACRGALHANGIAVIQGSRVVGGKACMETKLIHTSGQWLSSLWEMMPAKEDPQSMGSAITYMRRYSLSARVGILAADDDGNAASKPGLSPKSDQRMADNIDAYAKNAKSVAIANLKERAKGMSSDLSSVAEESELAGFLTGYAGLMNELKKELPDWHKAALDAVEGKRESFKQIASGGAG